MNGLLNGIRVVELGTHIAVPKAARVMADWGAEVIKVEPPKGEAWRTMGREWNMPCTPDNNPIFQAENANKKSLALNLKTPEGREALLDLLATADIFLTNTRPQALKRLGLTYEELKDRFPGLIYAHFTAYGKSGPDKDAPGFDSAAYWGRSGALLEWTSAGHDPFRPFPGFGDSTCSGYLLSGIMAALVQKLRTGKGELVELSLFGTALWFNSIGVIMGQPQYGKQYPMEPEKQPNAFVFFYQTKDGDWIVTGTSTWEQHAPGVFRILGLPEYAEDPEYVDLERSRTHMPEVIAALRRGYAQTDTATILKGFAEIGLVHARIRNPAEISTDPQAWENGYLREVTLECGDQLVLPNTPVHFGSQETFPYELGPALGRDSEAILSSLGYSQEKISDMVKQGCLGVQTPEK